MRLVAIVAADEGGVIGAGGKLPWHLPADLQRFKRLTLGKPILMGRKTYASIGKPLPGRLNVVLTRGDPAPLVAAGCAVAGSLDEALALPEVAAAPEVMIIGGAGLFAEALPRCDELWLTRVHHGFEGDVRLEGFDPEQWQELSREEVPADAKNAYATTFLRYVRR